MRALYETIGRTPTLLRFGVALGILTMPAAVDAQIYKCVDAGAHVSYWGKPCPPGTTQAGTFRDARSPRRSLARAPTSAAPESAPPARASLPGEAARDVAKAAPDGPQH